MAPPSAPSERFDESISSLLKDQRSPQISLHIIDREVDKVKSYMIALWKRRNSIVPISQLPPEVLCRIFYFTSLDPSKGPLHWIKVSHVSHMWRNIAVNSASLWTNPPLSNGRWTEEMLSRSKMASLTVDANVLPSHYSRYPREETVSLVLHHASRIRFLDLSHYNAAVLQKYLSELPKSARMLETLCIQASSQSTLVALNEQGCELPEEALGETDRLRRLELTNCAISWDSQLLGSSLVYLKLHTIPLSRRPTPTQFWNALRRMPALENIYLQDALPVVDGPQPSSSPQQTIFLGHLHQLTIQSSTPEVEMFLNGVSFPPMVTVKVSCKASKDSGPNFAGILSAISRFLSPYCCGRSICTLHVLPYGSGLDGYRFRAHSDIVSGVELWNATPIVDFALNYETPSTDTTPSPFDKLLVDFCAAIPLGNLVNLCLYHDFGFSSSTLAKTFGILPRLRLVAINGPCVKNFILALQQVQPSHLAATGNLLVSFVSLRSISMNDVTFEGGHDDEDISIDLLQGCLIWRYECGVEVHNLKLEKCSRLEKSDVGLLREIVVDLEWDEVEMDFTEDEDEDDENEYGYDYDYDDYEEPHSDDDDFDDEEEFNMGWY